MNAESLPGLRLPPELERSIFEVAALSHPIGIPTLMLVAWRIRNWIEPLLYRVLWIGGKNTRTEYGFPVITAAALLRALNSRPTLFATAVECLLFDGDLEHLPGATLDIIFSACPGITTLCSCIDLEERSLKGLESLRNLRHLRLDALGLFIPANVDFTHPLFRNLTHLELFVELPEQLFFADAEDLYAVMTTGIPNLTHIAFDQPVLGRFMEPLFEPHARLCCFVLFYDMTDELLAGPRRAEVVHIPADFDFRADWFRGVQTGEDHWTLAEEFIAAKRAGRVDSSIYTISAGDSFWRI
ncbi:hypothetical protein C8R46DRAFT_1262683 [Mycena filopes]|nr:hypothetical protein C8R46DRAFT_1262683 [Mycena filopes]